MREVKDHWSVGIVKCVVVLICMAVGYVVAEVLILKDEMTFFPPAETGWLTGDRALPVLLSIPTIIILPTVFLAVANSKFFVTIFTLMWLGFTIVFFGHMFDAAFGHMEAELRFYAAIPALLLPVFGCVAFCKIFYREASKKV